MPTGTIDVNLDPISQVIWDKSLEHLIDLVPATASTRKTPFPLFTKRRLQIRTKEGERIAFNLNRMQRRYLARKRLARKDGKGNRILLLKYRRGGFTTFEQAESYELVAENSNKTAVTVAHTKESTAIIFRIAQMFHRHDPDAPPLKNTGNAHKLEFHVRNSIFGIGTAGAAAPGVGDTIQRVHGSEVSKWCLGPNQIEKQKIVLAGYTEAASHGDIVLETTPNGVEHFCLLYRDAKQGKNEWLPVFIPWFEDRGNVDRVDDQIIEEIRDTLSDRERDLIATVKLNWGQVAWRRRQARSLGSLFPQEYPEDDVTCFLTSGIRFLDMERVISLLETTPDYDRPHVPGGYKVVWKPPEAGRKYVIGVDTSEGVEGCDPSGAGVLDYETCEQVAAVHGIFTPAVLAKHTIALHREYNRAMMGIERENHGHAVLQKIEDLGYKDPRILFFYTSGRAGWTTNAETRPVMLDDIAEAVHEGWIKVNDRDFLAECATFGKHGSKWKADPGCHDDVFMKWAIAWQVRKRRPPAKRSKVKVS